MTLERDTLLHNRYRIVEILGQGGMGSVYRAVDENLGVDVAVKENLFTTDEYARQFRLEAVILANLRHPNLTRVTDHFVIGNQGQYLVLDFIEGEDLRERMERLGSITEEEAILIGVAVCDALTYMHSRKPPILHRDVKPGNVKITPDGHIFLVDFGLAKILVGSQATTTGARAMTPGYSPPEQYGTARTDPRTDIYSLGATLYAALTGVIPEDGLARVIDHLELTPLRKRNPQVSKRLANVLEKALEVRTDNRYQTAEEFKKALIGSNTKNLHLNGDLLVEPPPVFDGKVDIQEPGDKAFSNEKKSDPRPEPPMAKYASGRKGIGKGFWIFISASLLLVLLAVMSAPYYWSPLAQIIDHLRASPTAVSTLTKTQASPDLTKGVTQEGTSLVVVPVASLTPTVPVSDTPEKTPTERPTSVPPTSTSIQDPTESATAVITPDGGGSGQIAFASDRTGIPQVFLVNVGSNNPRQLTNLPDGACQPSWSPDGSRLVFTSPCEKISSEYPNSSLFIINADGTGLEPLPTAEGGDFDPTWSPDGTRIAFTSLRDGFAQVYILNLDSDSAERMTQTDESEPARQPAWNPFASLIAYSQKRYDIWQIWVMTDIGTGSMPLVLSGPDYWDSQPVWSVDGATILFTQSKKLSTTSWLMSMLYSQRESGWATPIPKGTYASGANYSTDGTRLVFESIDGLNDDIYLLDLTTESRQLLVSDPAVDFDPVWRPSP